MEGATCIIKPHKQQNKTSRKQTTEILKTQTDILERERAAQFHTNTAFSFYSHRVYQVLGLLFLLCYVFNSVLVIDVQIIAKSKSNYTMSMEKLSERGRNLEQNLMDGYLH